MWAPGFLPRILEGQQGDGIKSAMGWSDLPLMVVLAWPFANTITKKSNTEMFIDYFDGTK